MHSRLESAPRPIITLTTDFGLQDGYVAAMQGVILGICPEARLVHISHQIPPQDIQTAAFVLYQAFGYFPPHTVHCVVVDPGVGSKRRAIAIRTSHGVFVGPDNGVFSLALAAPGVNVQEAVILSNPAYQLGQVSATFHGRDIFAPAAAHLARGVSISRFGPTAINLVRLPYSHQLDRSGSADTTPIIHIDHFGNLVLGLTAAAVDHPEEVTFVIKGERIRGLHRTFADVPDQALLAYVGSTYDHVEIAVRNGSAARRLNARVGDEVQVIDSPFPEEA
ncbi:MAG: hypothetical protein D6784_01510 [Chloroflexi bacterium]|nr:MAG: hypothetical protein D6784_01510 [Chloroflexota bacterium]